MQILTAVATVKLLSVNSSGRSLLLWYSGQLVSIIRPAGNLCRRIGGPNPAASSHPYLFCNFCQTCKAEVRKFSNTLLAWTETGENGGGGDGHCRAHTGADWTGTRLPEWCLLTTPLPPALGQKSAAWESNPYLAEKLRYDLPLNAEIVKVQWLPSPQLELMDSRNPHPILMPQTVHDYGKFPPKNHE